MYLHTIPYVLTYNAVCTYVQSVDTLRVSLICTYAQPIDTLDACLTCTYIQSIDTLDVSRVHTNHQVCFMHYYLVCTFACTHMHHVAHGLTYQCTDCLTVLTGVIV
jgi:hypothetical protein